MTMTTVPIQVHLDRLNTSSVGIQEAEDPTKPSSNRSNLTFSTGTSSKDARKAKRRLMAVMKKNENKICAECSEKRPTYGAFVRPPVNKHGVPLVPGSKVYCAFCCLQCATAHRNLGENISSIRSTRGDEWTEDQLQAAELGGNKRITEIYEANLHDNPANSTSTKPMAGSHAATRDRFVQNKYVSLLYYSQSKHVEWVQKQALAGGVGTPQGAYQRKRISRLNIDSKMLKSPGDNTVSTETLTTAQTPSPGSDENDRKPARRTSLALMLSKNKGGKSNQDEDEKSFVSALFSATKAFKAESSNDETFNASAGAMNAVSPGALAMTPRKKRASLVGLFRSAGSKSPRANGGTASVMSSGASLAENLSMVSSNTPGSSGSGGKAKYNRHLAAPSNRMLIKQPSMDLKEFANNQKSNGSLDVSLHDSDSFNESVDFDDETAVPAMGNPMNDSQNLGKPRPKLLSAPDTPNHNNKKNARMNLYSAGGGVRNKHARDRSRSTSRDRNGRNDSNSDLKAMIDRDRGSSSSLRRPRSTSRARDSISCSNDRLGTDVAKQSPAGRSSSRGRSRGRGQSTSEKEVLDQNNASFVSSAMKDADAQAGHTRSARRGRDQRSRSTSRTRDGERKDYYDSSSGTSSRRNRSTSRTRSRSTDDGDYYKKDDGDNQGRPTSRRSRSSQRGLDSARTLTSRDEDDNLQPQSTTSRARRGSTDSVKPASERSTRRKSIGAEKRIPSDPLRGRDRGRASRSRTRSTSRSGGERTRSSSRTTSDRARGSSRTRTRSTSRTHERARSSSRTRGDMGSSLAASRKRADEQRSRLRDQSRERFKSSLANKTLQASLNASKLNASALLDRSLSVDEFLAPSKDKDGEDLDGSNGSLESEMSNKSNLSKNLTNLFSGSLTADSLTMGEKANLASSGRPRRANKRNMSEGSMDRSGHSCASNLSGDSSVDETFLKEQAETKARIKSKDFKKGGESYLRMQRRSKDRLEQRKQQRDNIKSSIFAALDREEEDLVKTTSGPLMRARAAPSRSKSADLTDMHARPLMGLARTRSEAVKPGSISGRSRLKGGSFHGLARAGASSPDLGFVPKPLSRNGSGAWQKRKAENQERKENFEASIGSLDFDMNEESGGED